MYKVVLIDDEFTIVDGLSRVMPWAEYHCEVVATASDVASGIHAIFEHQPDILFTDIRMPDGDGLTMLTGLRSEHPDMQITVLTGYRDFTYAQQAIHLGVTRFLLKPSKMDELEEALSVMVTQLEAMPEQPSNNKERNQDVSNHVVREALNYIESNYADKLTLSEVADACYVSQWHLSKLLSENTQRSFYDILNQARTNAAKELLDSTTMRIGEIAQMVGYTGGPHFSRVFKKPRE